MNDVLEYIKKSRWELYSFDQQAANNYGCKWNHPFYPIENNECAINNKTSIDCIWVGYNKNRLNVLCNLKKQLDKQKISSKFIVREWSKFQMFRIFDKNINGIKITHKETPYSKVLKMIKSCKCIVDITQKNQSGLTMRVMEALCYKKKLITNNISIKDLDIYNRNNIYILGHDNMEDLYNFINSPYQEVNKKELMEYGVGSWLYRFDIDKKGETI